MGGRRIAHELARVAPEPTTVPSRSTVYRILVRHGLIEPRSRRRKRSDYLRWELEAPMQLWQLDIVGEVFLLDGTECKVVTGVEDHSRFCVTATVVPKATGRAVQVPKLRINQGCNTRIGEYGYSNSADERYC